MMKDEFNLSILQDLCSFSVPQQPKVRRSHECFGARDINEQHRSINFVKNEKEKTCLLHPVSSSRFLLLAYWSNFVLALFHMKSSLWNGQYYLSVWPPNSKTLAIHITNIKILQPRPQGTSQPYNSLLASYSLVTVTLRMQTFLKLINSRAADIILVLLVLLSSVWLFLPLIFNNSVRQTVTYLGKEGRICCSDGIFNAAEVLPILKISIFVFPPNKNILKNLFKY